MKILLITQDSVPIKAISISDTVLNLNDFIATKRNEFHLVLLNAYKILNPGQDVKHENLPIVEIFILDLEGK